MGYCKRNLGVSDFYSPNAIKKLKNSFPTTFFHSTILYLQQRSDFHTSSLSYDGFFNDFKNIFVHVPKSSLITSVFPVKQFAYSLEYLICVQVVYKKIGMEPTVIARTDQNIHFHSNVYTVRTTVMWEEVPRKQGKILPYVVENFKAEQ